MKRIYLKPEIKTLQLRLTTFLTAGSGSGAQHGITDGESTTPIGDATEDDRSRSWGQGMWDDMN